jgi:hypothetical protein
MVLLFIIQWRRASTRKKCIGKKRFNAGGRSTVYMPDIFLARRNTSKQTDPRFDILAPFAVSRSDPSFS